MAGVDYRAIVVVLGFALASACAVRGADGEPKFGAMQAAAVETEQRLASGSAAWTAVRGWGELELLVKVVSTPQGRAIQVLGRQKGKTGDIIHIVERDGLWYVREGASVPTKCRPYEYPFLLPHAPRLLEEAQPYVLGVEKREELGTFVRREGPVAVYRAPHDPAAAKQAEDALKQFERLAASSPKGLSPEFREVEAKLRRVLEQGETTRVDVGTGLVVERGRPDAPVKFENFRWLDEAPRGALSVEGTEWVDRSDGPLAGDRDPDELVMFLHGAELERGVDPREANGRILDLKSGRLWRIAFRGAGAIPGCFLPARPAEVFSGLSYDEGGWGLYWIDLETGDSSQMGGGVFVTGTPGDMAVAPDGRTLAVVHVQSVGEPSRRQLYLIDLETDETTPVGEIMHIGSISWLPDGKGLIVVRSDQPDDLNQPAIGMICRMDLDRKVTELRRGSDAVVLDGERMLFQDEARKVWKTCTLEGKDEALFGDGLEGYFRPALSPDGKRIIFMRNVPQRGPTPFVFEVGQAKGRVATQMRGLWASPQWR
jgi:hypothetical protein